MWLQDGWTFPSSTIPPIQWQSHAQLQSGNQRRLMWMEKKSLTLPWWLSLKMRSVTSGSTSEEDNSSTLRGPCSSEYPYSSGQYNAHDCNNVVLQLYNNIQSNIYSYFPAKLVCRTHKPNSLPVINAKQSAFFHAVNSWTSNPIHVRMLNSRNLRDIPTWVIIRFLCLHQYGLSCLWKHREVLTTLSHSKHNNRNDVIMVIINTTLHN